MAASDHVSDYIRVYHSSYDQTSPHNLEPMDLAGGYENWHPDVLHTGTEESANHLGADRREWMHSYLVPKGSLYPVTFGDEGPEHDYERPKYKQAMEGVQPDLWESVMGDPKLALETQTVLPYRNRVEDAGSISYMIPKSMIRGTDEDDPTRPVVYVGSRPRSNREKRNYDFG